jgi:hypothetical protein
MPARFSARHQAVTSGNRWTARLKGSARSVRDGEVVFDRAIDRSLCKLDRQRGWRRAERGTHGGGGHADRAEIVGLVVGGTVLGLIAMNRSDRCDQRVGSLRAIRRVYVTEGQSKIHGDRDEREP